MTPTDSRASALALAEPVPTDAGARRIEHEAVQRAAMVEDRQLTEAAFRR